MKRKRTVIFSLVLLLLIGSLGSCSGLSPNSDPTQSPSLFAINMYRVSKIELRIDTSIRPAAITEKGLIYKIVKKLNEFSYVHAGQNLSDTLGGAPLDIDIYDLDNILIYDMAFDSWGRLYYGQLVFTPSEASRGLLDYLQGVYDCAN